MVATTGVIVQSWETQAIYGGSKSFLCSFCDRSVVSLCNQGIFRVFFRKQCFLQQEPCQESFEGQWSFFYALGTLSYKQNFSVNNLCGTQVTDSSSFDRGLESILVGESSSIIRQNMLTQEKEWISQCPQNCHLWTCSCAPFINLHSVQYSVSNDQYYLEQASTLGEFRCLKGCVSESYRSLKISSN